MTTINVRGQAYEVTRDGSTDDAYAVSLDGVWKGTILVQDGELGAAVRSTKVNDLDELTLAEVGHAFVATLTKR